VSTSPTRGQRRPKVRVVSRHKIPLPPQLKRVNLNAAGIDIGSEEHWTAVPPGRDSEGQDVRRFAAFTGEHRRREGGRRKGDKSNISAYFSTASNNPIAFSRTGSHASSLQIYGVEPVGPFGLVFLIVMYK
jgi:hypothetical protein